MKLQSYIAIFEQIAAELVAINHSASNRHFIAMAPEQVPNATLDDLSSPIFILEDYDILPWIDNHGSLVKKIQGAFAIVVHAPNSSIQDEIDAVVFAEIHVEQVLAKLRAPDSFGLMKQKYLRLESCEASPVRHYPVNYFGFRCSFVWEIPYALCVNDDLWQTNQNLYAVNYVVYNYFL